MPVVTSQFAANLRALQLFDPRSAACLAQWPGRDAGRESGRDPDVDVPAAAAQDTIVLLGIGQGINAVKLLGACPARLLVIEGDMDACAAALARHDFSAALAAGRLQLLLAPAQSAAAREIFLRECVAEIADRLQQPNCRVSFVATASSEAQGEFFQALYQGAENTVRAIDEFASLRGRQPAYDVTVVSPCCAIFDDLAACLSRLGKRVQLLRVPDRPGVWSAEQVHAARSSLAQAPSRLVITRNRALLETGRPTDCPQPEALMASPVAMWWWDVPNVATRVDLRHRRGLARSFGFARDILALLPRDSEWLPPAARMQFVEAGAQPDMPLDIEVSFVGQSRLQDLHVNVRSLKQVLHELGAAPAALARDLERMRRYEELHAYLATHRRDIRDAIARLERAFPAHAYFLHYLLDMAVTGAFRIAGIERLLKEGVEVALYGDDDWLKVPGVTPHCFKGLCAPEQLPALYRRSRINLNLNFMQVSSTVNPKVLDIAAAGGAALTDYRPELDLLYPDPAARPFAFASLDELVERTAALKQADLGHHRRAVRAHTCAHHTMQQRAQWLLRHFGL